MSQFLGNLHPSSHFCCPATWPFYTSVFHQTLVPLFWPSLDNGNRKMCLSDTGSAHNNVPNQCPAVFSKFQNPTMWLLWKQLPSLLCSSLAEFLSVCFLSFPRGAGLCLPAKERHRSRNSTGEALSHTRCSCKSKKED